jgi:anhydro-N-acetylmuramic acid kinase
MDGIDAALVRLGDRTCEVLSTSSHDYPDRLSKELHDVVRQPERCTIDDIGRLDRWVGECFRDATLTLLQQSGTDSAAVRAIGSHGQTIRHQPRADKPFTLQIGDPNVIAAGTGIDTVADFRRRDMAVGGEGAPLAPAFHAWLFSQDSVPRVVLNIGGIANITILSPGGTVVGFDTGPGNTLLDAWIGKHLNVPYDDGGTWGASGTSSEALLKLMLADPYFSTAPPKSTGPEYFNLGWLASINQLDMALPPEDVQATLTRLTACTIVNSITQYASGTRELLICGGGSKNRLLLNLLTAMLPGLDLRATDDYGLDADWVEAAAFAWLARQFLQRKPGNLPSVTGARQPAILGSLYLGNG